MACETKLRVPKSVDFLILSMLLGASVAQADVVVGYALNTSSVGEHGAPMPLVFEDHDFVNPWAGGVAWRTPLNADVLSMEWAFIGVSDVLPTCAGSFDWSTVDQFLVDATSRGHQAILRPVFFGPGYVSENYAPTDLAVSAFIYEGSSYDNPRWDLLATQECILKFIDAFAARYKSDLRVAFIQMGLVGLWGEHHLDGGPYTASNFPSMAFQKTMINRYLLGFGSSSSDLLSSISLDSAQQHGFFSTADTSFDSARVGFFDDSLLIANHGAPGNWRQQPHPAEQLALHKLHGWGGEAFWTKCNSDGSWVNPPNDCGNGEGLGAQAQRIGLSYMLGSPAFTEFPYSSEELLAASQMMGYKFTTTDAVRQDAGHLAITVLNTGTSYCPYKVEVCTQQGCGGDLSTLAPGNDVVVEVPASALAAQDLFFASPRLDPAASLKIRWSNAGADDTAGTLTVVVDGAEQIFADGFDSGSTNAWSSTLP